MTTNRFRLKFTFWLDVLKPEQEELAETIEDLKKDRSFVRTIRDGIRLVVSLRERRTDVLFEMFPFLQPQLSQAEPESNKSVSHLEKQLERIEQLLQKQPEQPQAQAVGLKTMNGGGIKQLNVSSFETPAFDDDDEDLLIIKKDESSGEVAINNFLKSISALSG